MADSLEKKLEYLKTIGTADVADTMSKRFGLRRFSIDDHPSFKRGEKFAGPAYILSYVNTGRGEKPLPFYETLLDCPKDSVVVMAGADKNRIHGGDVVARYVRHCGAQALVVDGRMRDVETISKMEMPICCCGYSTYIPDYSGDVMAVNVPVTIDGALVNPGDILFGDDDGIVVIPGPLLDQVVYQAQDMVRIENEYTEVFDGAKPGENLCAKLREVGGQKAVRLP